MRKLSSALVVLALAAGCSEVTSPRTGSAWVRMVTSGDDFDANGYGVIVDSIRRINVGPQGSLTLDSLRAGPHLVQIDNVADNCVVAEPAGTRFTVVPDQTTNVEVAVDCKATGVEITTATTGPDQPAFSGFLARIGNRIEPVPLKGVTRISRLEPGSYSLAIQTHENCSVPGGSSRNVKVENRQVVPIDFAIECVDTKKDIVFSRDTAMPPLLLSGILSASASGGGMIELVRQGYDPAWSPDGSRIVFSNTNCDYYYYYAGMPCSGGLAILDLRSRVVLTGIDGLTGIDPAWSPDGSSIVYARRTQTSTRLMLAALDGRPAVDLAPPVLGVNNPTWSPDGSRIAFGCSTGTSANSDQICLINRDGTGFRTLTSNATWSGGPSWSPDGATIAFTMLNNTTLYINVMREDGTAIRRLTPGRDPAWSPDGSKILFVDLNGLFTVRPDGSELTRLTTGNHSDPAWRP